MEQFALRQKEESFYCMFVLGKHALCIGVDDTVAFERKLRYMVNPKEHHVAPITQKCLGRPIKVIDCSKLCKGDALGELYALSKLNVNPTPIVIIENITQIPQEDNYHDNPKYVEDLLLHGWREHIRVFTNTKYGDFSIETGNYTILIPWDHSQGEIIRTIWHKADGLAWMESLQEELKDWKDVGFEESRDYLLKNGHIIPINHMWEVKQLRTQLSIKPFPVSSNPGTYVLWVLEQPALKLLADLDGVEPLSIRRRLIGGWTYLALYFGVSANLLERAKWHFCQKHTKANVASGRLSTLRQSISALMHIKMSGSECCVNAFFDSYCYWEWAYAGDKKTVEILETKELSSEYYPLNIQKNTVVPKTVIQSLRRLRKQYRK